MIDLGIIQLPLEVLNVVVILTATFLAANYIGFHIVSAVGGLIAAVYGIRAGFFGDELVVNGYQFNIYEAWLLIIVGGFLLYRGTTTFFNENDTNTWK